MKITAGVASSQGIHETRVSTNGNEQTLSIPPRANGTGSSVNGGELLFLALATCYCNDIYREAAKRGITVERVDVEVDGEFGTEGEPARRIDYRARVVADATESEITDLLCYTDAVAEIQNTVRGSTLVTLREVEAVSTQ